MPVEWSTSGPDVLLRLDRDSAVPLRTQLETQLREAIRSGRLEPGERLPSSRAFASSLGLSRGVVQDGFAQLLAEGYLVARGGSGTRVAPGPFTTDAPTPAPDPVASPQRPPLVADFASGVPDLASVPRGDWAWAVREVCRAAPNAAFDYGDPRGDATLRAVLAAYLGRVRATAAGPDEVVVCGGFQQGLALVLGALVETGRTTVGIEDPGSVRRLVAVARACGAAAVPVPVDEGGIDVAALAASPARVVVVTPAHQWPTGVVLAPERRQQLIAWARERDAVIVEDDYDAEFRYDREPIGSLQGLAPDRVVSLGTVSKSLAPALRLGWAVLPPALIDAVVTGKFNADRATPGLDQLALATLLESGRYDRHLRRMRVEYAARRDALVASLAEHAPGVRVSGLAAGFHAVAHLAPGADEERLTAQARERRVGIYGMHRYRAPGSSGPPQLVVGFGNTGQRAIRAGIAAIGDLLDAAG